MSQAGWKHMNPKIWAIPAGLLTLGLVSVIANGAGPVSPKATVPEEHQLNHQVPSTSESPATTATPAPDLNTEITINGANIPTDSQGKQEVTIPGGKAQVEVSAGRTNVTAQTDHSTEGAAASTSSDSVDIRIQSNSTSTNPTIRSKRSFDSYSETSITSDGNTTVTITR